MTKGIREHVDAHFASLVPRFVEGDVDGTTFRRIIMDDAMARFQISAATAATHYNHSKTEYNLKNPGVLKDLGRPEGKKGGRPLEHPVTVVKAKSRAVVAQNISRGAAMLLIRQAELKGKTKLEIDEPAQAAA